MKNMFLIVLFLAACAFAINERPNNSLIIWEDSTYIDSTETKTFPLIWQDNGAYKALLIEARQDSTAGWSSDSAAVKIEYKQCFNVTNQYVSGQAYNYTKYIAILASHANPDSTAKHPANFVLFDSLDIKSMDTAAVYLRASKNDTARAGGNVSVTYNDSLKTLQTSGFGAFAYSALPIDYSPAYAIKITGLASNGKRGVGSFWRFRVYQMTGVPVKGK